MRGRGRTWAVLVAAVLLPVSMALGQAWREGIDKSLEKRKSYDFKSISLIDVFRLVSQDAEVNIIPDSGAGIDVTAKLTFTVKDMSLASVLSWATRLTGLEWCIQDEAVFVTKYDRLSIAARRDVERRNAARRAQATRTWYPPIQEKLSGLRSVTFDEKSLADCCDSLKTLMGINFIISARVDAKTAVDLNVSRMSGESVISWVARKAGIDYAILDEAIYFAGVEEIRALRFAGLDLSSQGRTFEAVTFEFSDTPLDEAIKTLSEKSGVQIVLRNASGTLPKVTLSGKEMPLTAALQTIVSRTGLIAAIIPEGNGLVISLMKPVSPLPATITGPQAPVKESAPSTDSALRAPASGGSGGATGD